MTSAAIDISQVVREAWTATLPDAEFVPERSWEDCGGDSLKAMQLNLRLENALGRKVPLDVLLPTTTPLQLSQALRPAKTRKPVLPHIFLVPGIGGDEPKLAVFRAHFGQTIRWTVLDMPGLSVSTKVLTRYSAMLDWMIKRIERKQPQGDILLAGYSMGGFVAHALAHRLTTEHGRNVAFLGLLDPLLPNEQDNRSGRIGKRVAPRPKDRPALGPLRRAIQTFVPTQGQGLRESIELEAYLRLGKMERARQVALRAEQRSALGVVCESKRIFLWNVRHHALQAWEPAPVNAYTVLFRTRHGRKRQTDVFWRNFMPKVRVVNLKASHSDMFFADSGNVLRDKLLGHVHKALAAIEAKRERQRLREKARLQRQKARLRAKRARRRLARIERLAAAEAP